MRRLRQEKMASRPRRAARLEAKTVLNAQNDYFDLNL
ncbi:MAG: hypothetical protein ACI93L_001348, partial [Cyclobacteriaceae bacterium]